MDPHRIWTPGPYSRGSILLYICVIEYEPWVVLFVIFIPDVTWKLSHSCDILLELKFSVFYKLLVACVSTVERETGLFKVSKHELVLHETLTQLFSPCIVFWRDDNE